MHSLPIVLFVFAVVSIGLLSLFKGRTFFLHAPGQFKTDGYLQATIKRRPPMAEDPQGMVGGRLPSKWESPPVDDDSTILAVEVNVIQEDDESIVEKPVRKHGDLGGHMDMGGRLDLGGATSIRKRGSSRDSIARLVMQVVISLAVLGGALYIIISQSYDPKDKHWAYGSAGTILGFWLKH